MTKIYFVRHAEPVHDWDEDRTRPLTEEGREDSKKVFEFLKKKQIDKFYCSPYRTSLDTIASAAEHFGEKIIIDERLRERKSGIYGNSQGMFQKRWADLEYHEEGGESIKMVQNRNVAALHDILKDNPNQTIVIGTHGTALSSILNYYESSFDCESFLRIIDWKPYIMELNFEGERLVEKIEHLHVYKEFKRKTKVSSSLGSIQTVIVDRPLGTYHPEHKDIYYPINYGYIKGIIAPDGEEQDAYILGVEEPVETFTGKVIAVIHRINDLEDKWVVCPQDKSYTKQEIEKAVHFQEQYFKSEIICAPRE